MPNRGDITEILLRVEEGSPGAAEQLYSHLYAELRLMARRHLHQERADHTLQPTELVHEAYVRLVDQTRCHWVNRGHFLAIASGAMRRILVDRARSRGREKRGGGWEKVPLDQILLLGTKNADEALLDLDRALSKFAEREPEKAQVVEMHFFGGLTRDECAEILGISPRTISRYWDYAQAWLHREIATTRPI